MPTTTHRGYFKIVPGTPPTEADLNAGFLDRVDADVEVIDTAVEAASASLLALTERVDAVINDDGGDSILLARVLPTEFQPFALGDNALSLNNFPVALDTTHFTVTANWTTEFTANRRLQVQAPAKAHRYPYVVAATFSNVTNKTTVTTAGDLLHLDMNEAALSRVVRGAPQLDPGLVPAGSLPLAKLATEVATQAELDAAQAALQGSIDVLEADVTSLAADLTAHQALTTGTHGLTGGQTFEHQAGAQAKVDTHNNDGAAHAALVAGLQLESEKAQPNGYASLDGSGKIPSAQLPAIGLKAIYKGVTVVGPTFGTPGSPAESTTFAAVDPNKTFIVASFRTTATSEDKAWTTWELAGTNDRLLFKRADAVNTTTTVAWQVVEFY